ncbi:MAG: hypothetical protein GVY33_13440 [Alphaproteobacteria bacterium]|jgi:hypothetical protein|nr:hypothetical protein [Alphaproteobacteria bacterium]
MTTRAEERELENDGVHAVDIVVKGRGVARLTRLTDSGDIEAALTVLKGRVEEPRTGAREPSENGSREGVPDCEASSGSPG